MPLAAREHRRRDLMDLGGGQDKNCVSGWFFERFQQGIKRRGRKHMHFIDNIDFVLPLVGREVDLVPQIPHIFDGCVGSGIDLDQVQEAPLVDGHTMGAGVAWTARRDRVQAVDRFRQQTRRGGLAGPTRARKQIGMRHPPGDHGVA